MPIKLCPFVVARAVGEPANSLSSNLVLKKCPKLNRGSKSNYMIDDKRDENYPATLKAFRGSRVTVLIHEPNFPHIFYLK